MAVIGKELKKKSPMTCPPSVAERFLQKLGHLPEYSGPPRVSPDVDSLGMKCLLICKHWITFKKTNRITENGIERGLQTVFDLPSCLEECCPETVREVWNLHHGQISLQS